MPKAPMTRRPRELSEEVQRFQFIESVVWPWLLLLVLRADWQLLYGVLSIAAQFLAESLSQPDSVSNLCSDQCNVFRTFRKPD